MTTFPLPAYLPTDSLDDSSGTISQTKVSVLEADMCDRQFTVASDPSSLRSVSRSVPAARSSNSMREGWLDHSGGWSTRVLTRRQRPRCRLTPLCRSLWVGSTRVYSIRVRPLRAPIECWARGWGVRIRTAPVGPEAAAHAGSLILRITAIRLSFQTPRSGRSPTTKRTSRSISAHSAHALLERQAAIHGQELGVHLGFDNFEEPLASPDHPTFFWI